MTSTLSHPHDPLARRRAALRHAQGAFGLDYVVTCDPKSRPPQIDVHLIGRLPARLSERNFELCCDGVQLEVALVKYELAEKIAILQLPEGTQPSSQSEYTLRLLYKQREPALDRYFASASFHWGCQGIASSDSHVPLPPLAAEPAAIEIDYLAKDYATFRRLMLDRLAATLPEWRDFSPADQYLMLVELLAYAADHLSYYQDAVATEAYLNTARLRPSLRRHARLVDYRVHEGCNARAWVHLAVWDDGGLTPGQRLFFVACPVPGVDDSPFLTAKQLQDLRAQSAACEVFEPVVSKDFPLWTSHNACRLHTWCGVQPCLPKGATQATLLDEEAVAAGLADGPPGDARPLQFQVGDVVLFEELRDPWTGVAADADVSHRHVVRLTEFVKEYDAVAGVHVLKIYWHVDDALPFTLWIEPPPGADWQGRPFDNNILAARGNMLLVDHGQSASEIVTVRRPGTAWSEDVPAAYPTLPVTGTLETRDLTHSASLPASCQPAAAQVRQDPHRATPQLLLAQTNDRTAWPAPFTHLEMRDAQRVTKRLLDGSGDLCRGAAGPLAHAARCCQQWHTQFPPPDAGLPRPRTPLPTRLTSVVRAALNAVWLPQTDLLSSGPVDAHVVVEMTDDRQAQLRFGGHGRGRLPEFPPDQATAELRAEFRIGNGAAGNVAAEAIRFCGAYVGELPPIAQVRNPLPAVGGVDPETPAQVRALAPHALRTALARAVTAADYEQLVRRDFAARVQNAKATLRWTGRMTTVLVAVDPLHTETPDVELLDEIRRRLAGYRRLGHEVQVCPAARVVIDISLVVCVAKHAVASQVRDALDRLFGNGLLADGSPALFHPDRQTFGEGVYLSQLAAAAAGVPGVSRVDVTRLCRRGAGQADELQTGLLLLADDEIVQFENNPRRPELGRLVIDVKGGR